MDEIDDDQRPAEHQNRPILPCIRQRLGTGTEQLQQGIPEQEHQPADHRAGDQRHPEAEGADAADGIRFLFSKQTGNQGTAALAEDVAEGHQDHEKRRADRNAGDQFRIVRLGNEVGIRQIVDDGDDGPDHHGKRQMEIRCDDMFGIQAAGFPVFFHVSSAPFRIMPAGFPRRPARRQSAGRCFHPVFPPSGQADACLPPRR